MKKKFIPCLEIFPLCILLFASASPVAASPDLFSHFSEKYEDVLVTKVIRADTFTLESGERVKMIGLKAMNPPKPEKIEYDAYGYEIKKETHPWLSIEEKSLDFVKKLLEGQRVRLEFDVQKADESKNTLAYVFLPDGMFINAEVLRWGYAYLQIRPPNLKYEEALTQAYREAREEKRGLQGE